MRKLWIASSVIATVVGIGGVVRLIFPQGFQLNPYGLSTSEQSTIVRYFATA